MRQSLAPAKESFKSRHGEVRFVRVVVLALAAIVLAGCLSTVPGQGTPTTGSVLPFASQVLAAPSCPNVCFEPTMASDGNGLVAVLPPAGPNLYVSRDGGLSFAATPRPLANFEGLSTSSRDDTLLIGPHGRLWFTTLVSVPAPIPIGPGGNSTPPIFDVQVASSDDGGTTWRTNVMVGASRNDDPSGIVPDRPWLGFVGDATVYLTVNRGAGVLIARSDDAGASFGPLRLAIPAPPAFNGYGLAQSPPAVLRHDVFIAYANDLGLFVGVSHDRGTSFTSLQALPSDPSTSNVMKFPALAARENELLLVWSQASGPVWISRSEDGGGTWATPFQVGHSGTCASPWLATTEGGADVFWFDLDQGPRLMWSHLSGSNWFHEAVHSVQLAGPFQAAPEEVACPGMVSVNTDFAQGASIGDGKVAAVYADFRDRLPRLGVGTLQR